MLTPILVSHSLREKPLHIIYESDIHMYLNYKSISKAGISHLGINFNSFNCKESINHKKQNNVSKFHYTIKYNSSVCM